MTDQYSDKKQYQKPGILRLDISKPRRSSGGSVEFRSQPELLGELSTATTSPPTTSPQLSVTWAFSPQESTEKNDNLSDDRLIPSNATSSSHEIIQYRKSPFLSDYRRGRKNSTLEELNQHSRDKLIESFFMEPSSPIDLPEQINSEDEDYSLSVSAVMHRRASTKGYRKKGYISSRRTSSPMDHVTGLMVGGSGGGGGGGGNSATASGGAGVTTTSNIAGISIERRRSSVYTTSSGDTAISIGDGTNQGSTKEQIFENIRLHKEVLQSVKLQPWSMRRKLRLVRQAKEYVARHEGALQERFAMSRSTKDLWARFKILLAAKWQHYRREIANISTVLIPWELRIKEIESHFGSVVASYFTFLRWLFWVNIVIAVVLTVFVVAPELIASEWPPKPKDHRKEMLPDEKKNATRLMTIWDFEGRLKYSPLFYGYYSDFSGAIQWHYQLPLAYFLTGIVVYIYSFWATLRKMAENSRMSKLSSKDDECVFSWKLFTGWDFMIGHAETAHNRIASVVLGFKEALLEEAEKKKAKRNWKVIVLRIFVNLLVLGLLIVSAGAVVQVVQRSAQPEANSTYWRRNEITVVITAISFFFPMFFEILGILEIYHPRKQLRMQLARIMALNLLNLYALIFALFNKIEAMNSLLKLIKNDINNPVNATQLPMFNSTTMSSYSNYTNSTNMFNNVDDTATDASPSSTILTTQFPDVSTLITSTISTTNDVASILYTTLKENASFIYNLFETTDAPTTEMHLDEDTDCYRVRVDCPSMKSPKYNVNLTTTLFLITFTTTIIPELMNKLNYTNYFNISNEFDLNSTAIYDSSTDEFERFNLTNVFNNNNDTNNNAVEYSDYNDFEDDLINNNSKNIESTTVESIYEYDYDNYLNDEDISHRNKFKRMLKDNSKLDTDDSNNNSNSSNSVYDYMSTFFKQLNDNLLNNINPETKTTENASIDNFTEYLRSTVDTFIENITLTGLWDTNTTDWAESQMMDIINSTTEFLVASTTTDSTTTESFDDYGLIENEDDENCYIIICKNNETTMTTDENSEYIYSTTEMFTTPLTPLHGDFISTTTVTETTLTPTTIKDMPTSSMVNNYFTTQPSTIVTNTNDDYIDTTTNNGPAITENDYGGGCTTNPTIAFTTTSTDFISSTAPSNCIISIDKDNNTDYDEACLSKLIYKMENYKQLELRKLCWETMFGQEMVKLTVMDLVATITSTLCMDFFRALFVRFMNKCWCWDLEKKFPKYGDFKIAENILHLINNQGQVWMGMFFSPGLAIINLFKLIILMYLRSWTVLTCNVPHEVVFRASRSNNFYLALLLTMLFLCVLPVGYAIVWIPPSWHCGPFSNYARIYYIFTFTLRKLLPEHLHHQMDYIASPSTVIPLLLLLVLIIYYLVSLTGALREANQDLKTQLRRERAEERRKMLKIPHAPSDDTNTNAANVIGRWRKVLEASSPLTPSAVGGTMPDQDEYNKIQARKELLARIMKKALRKSSNTSDDDSQPIAQKQHQQQQPQHHYHHHRQPPQTQQQIIAIAGDDETDTEQHESLPHDHDVPQPTISMAPLSVKSDMDKEKSKQFSKHAKRANVEKPKAIQIDSTVVQPKPSFSRMMDIVQSAAKRDVNEKTLRDNRNKRDGVNKNKNKISMIAVEDDNKKYNNKDSDDPSCQERVVSERRKSLLKRQNKLNDNDLKTNDTNKDDINYEVINERNKITAEKIAAKHSRNNHRKQLNEPTYFKFDTDENVSDSNNVKTSIVTAIDDHKQEQNDNDLSDDDNTSYREMELKTTNNKTIKDNNNTKLPFDSSPSSKSNEVPPPQYSSIKQQNAPSSNVIGGTKQIQSTESKSSSGPLKEIQPNEKMPFKKPITISLSSPTVSSSGIQHKTLPLSSPSTSSSSSSSTMTNKKPKNSFNSFLALVKEAVQVKKQLENENQNKLFESIPIDPCLKSSDDEINVQRKLSNESIPNEMKIEIIRKGSNHGNRSKPKREDSENSVWSNENIPVITISKTESSECILENQTQHQQQSPQPQNESIDDENIINNDNNNNQQIQNQMSFEEINSFDDD